MNNARGCSLVFFIILGTITASNAKPIKGKGVFPGIPGEYRFIASIGVKYSHEHHASLTHICSGMLISMKHVLTSAHCFEDHKSGKYLHSLDQIIVTVGTVDMMHGNRNNITMRISYDQWAKNKRIKKEFEINDLAIVKLSEKVDKKVAKPVSLSFTKPLKWVNKSVVIAGWGHTNHRSEPSRYMLKAIVKVLPKSECARLMFTTRHQEIPKTMSYICTKSDRDHNLIDCGDSGGPVLSKKEELLGVNLGNCPKHEFSTPLYLQANVHASIYYYKKFIKDVLKNY